MEKEAREEMSSIALDTLRSVKLQKQTITVFDRDYKDP